MMLLCAVLAACGDPQLPRKTVLARMPPGYVPGSFAVSDDFAHAAYQVKTRQGVRMVRDGVSGPTYRSIVTRSFAPRTDRLFYWARGFGPHETFLVENEHPHPVGASRHEYLVFTPDGRRWAVTAAVPASADGAPVPESARILVMADGVEQGRYPEATAPALSHDGRHLAYVVADAAPDGATRRRLLVDGEERRVFTGVAARCVAPVQVAGEGPMLPLHERVLYLSDGTLVALVRDGEGWVLERAGQPVATYAVSVPIQTENPVLEVRDEACRTSAAVASGSLTGATDAPVLAWWERVAGGPGERWRLVRDGAPVDDLTCVRPWEAQAPVLTADGRAWVYACVTGVPVTGQEVLVVTPAARHGPYREVWGLALSDDGRRVAYGASPEGGLDATWRIFADGEPVSPPYYATWRPRFDPSGRHVGWEAITKPGGRLVLGIDERALVRFDDLIDGPANLARGWMSWAVRNGRRLSRVNLRLPRD